MTYRRYTSRGLRRRLAVLASLTFAVSSTLVVGAAGAGAGDLSTQGANPEPARVAAGVTIGGVPVGGLTASEAADAAQASFGRPLELSFRRETRRYSPVRLGAVAAVDEAVAAALRAGPGAAVPLSVSVPDRKVRRLARGLDAAFSRKPVDTTASLRGQRPVLSKAQKGFEVERAPLVASLRHALRSHERAVEIPYTVVRPTLTRASYGPILVILRDSKRLRLYDGAKRRASFGIATGQASFPTPIGRFEVVTMQRDPWWYPPPSDWAKDLDPVPPGPGNPLGTRWMGLSAEFVGIHGTPDAASIGYSASHGCVRMRISEAEWLFERVEVGSPVFILAA